MTQKNPASLPQETLFESATWKAPSTGALEVIAIENSLHLMRAFRHCFLLMQKIESATDMTRLADDKLKIEAVRKFNPQLHSHLTAIEDSLKRLRIREHTPIQPDVMQIVVAKDPLFQSTHLKKPHVCTTAEALQGYGHLSSTMWNYLMLCLANAKGLRESFLH